MVKTPSREDSLPPPLRPRRRRNMSDNDNIDNTARLAALETENTRLRTELQNVIDASNAATAAAPAAA